MVLMEKIKETLDERQTMLRQILRMTSKPMKNVPDGRLRVIQNKGCAQYYLRSSPSDKNGVYLKKDQIQLAKVLAEKEYNEAINKAAKKELAAIERYLCGCPRTAAEDIYAELSPGRRSLVTPIRETDEEYAAEWSAKEYEGKRFLPGTPELFTERGERVRSKSEVMIADYLYRQGIPYRYEYPLYLDGFGAVYPDFTVLNVRTREEWFWEHRGMMDDPDYAEAAVKKERQYLLNGLVPGKNLILTAETLADPLDPQAIRSVAEAYLL